jgi:hypothetical protein
VSLVELTDRRGEKGRRGGGGVKLYDSEDVWSSINYSILFGDEERSYSVQ